MENYSDFRRTNYPGLLMYFVAHYLEVEQNKLLRPYGVTHSQTQLLAYLYAHQDQDIFQKDLERIFNLKGSTVTRLLQLLKDKGLVTSQECVYDKRAKLLSITEKAAGLHEVFSGTLDSVEQIVADQLSEDELAELKVLMTKVYKGIYRGQD